MSTPPTPKNLRRFVRDFPAVPAPGSCEEFALLQYEASTDLQTRTRIGELFLSAGSPVRAADVFQDILRPDSENADAYAGFGEAEFAGGNYQPARTDFLNAS